MKWHHVRAVLRREWIEMRRNRLVLLTMAILPLALVGASIGTIAFLAQIPDRSLRGEMPAVAALGASRDALLVLVADQYLYMLLLLALALPSTIAAHAIVGEKVEKTLEPLLATPIATWDLLFAKCLAAVVPAIVVTLSSYGVTMLCFYFICPPAVFALVMRPAWPLAFLLVAPLMSLLSALAAIIASSRVNDPRTAQGLVGFLVIPVIFAGMSAVMGQLFLDEWLLAQGALGIVLVDFAVLWLAVKLLLREAILTRWK